MSDASAPYVPAGMPPRPVRAPEPVPAPVLASPSPPETAFPADMLRELGILRNSLEAKLEKKTGRVLMFTSAMHQEGVSTLAAAYTRLLSLQHDQRILLVELNARTPSLASRFGVTGVEGVTHYFSQGRSLSSLVQRPLGETFDVVHVGTPDATQIQINLERAFPHLVEEALRSYDTVIIDAPPVVVCPETPPLTPFVDGVVIVVQSARTKRETIGRSIAQIQQFKGRVLGVVLNRKRYYIPEFIYRRL
jgi:Mrp family chromosome partitioning ATPase